MQPVHFGKFWLLEQIAAGGMAEIYKAAAAMGDGRRHIVAVKRILPQFSTDEEFVSLLMDEAKLMVLLNHPNVIPMLEFGKIEDSYYIAMEFVDGPTLKGLFKKVRDRGDQLTIDMAVHIVREIGTGLAYAHRKTDENGNPMGLVHRDISPANILISYDGEVKVADFGISKAANQSHRTQIGVIRGKTGYMSPEQTRSGIEIDQRSDIYALGIILFELLTGQRLYKADSVPEALKMIRKGEIPPMLELRPDIPPALEVIARKALAVDPGNRYQRAEEFVDALNEFLARAAPGSRPLRVTHADLVGFLQRYFPNEMAARQTEATAMILDDAPTLVEPKASPKAEITSVSQTRTTQSTMTTRPHTLAANPLYELSDQEFVAPPDGDLASSMAAKVDTGSFQEAVSASLRIARRFSPLVLSGVAGGIIVVTLMFGLLKRNTVRSPTPPTATPAAVATVARPTPKPVGAKPVPTEAAARAAETADIVIATNPLEAKVEVNKRELPDKRMNDVPVGTKLTIKVSALGFKAQSKTVVVQPTPWEVPAFILVPELSKRPTPRVGVEVLGGKATPVPSPGRLKVLPLPNAWARVSVDGKVIGDTPILAHSIASGSHRLSLRISDNSSVEGHFVVRPGKETTCKTILKNRTWSIDCK